MKDLALHSGDFVDERWKIVDKLGEGGCGKVYEVKNVKNGLTYAMKIESTKTRRFNQLLKTEAQVLRQVQFSAHVPSFLCCVSTTLRIGLQALQAIWDVHRTYYVHRDIKPSNFAIGLYPNHRRVYLFDFGLSRSLLDVTSTARRLRVSRHNIAFRGTVNYCSPNVHDGMEHGRHDDLWSLLYVCIEMIRGYLPWQNLRRKKAALLKREAGDKFLLMGCPIKFKVLLDYLRRLRYHHCPDYVSVYELLKSCIVARHIDDDDQLDWEACDGRSAVGETQLKKSTYLMPRNGEERSTIMHALSHADERISSHSSISSPSDSLSTRRSPSIDKPSADEKRSAENGIVKPIASQWLSNKAAIVGLADASDRTGCNDTSSFLSSHDIPSTPTFLSSSTTLPLSSPTPSLSYRTERSRASLNSLKSLDDAFAALSVSTAHGPPFFGALGASSIYGTITAVSEKSSDVSDIQNALSTCRNSNTSEVILL